MKRSPFKRPAAGLRIVAKAEPEILLYDEIGYWGITAEAFKRELDAITADTIHLRINSPGGEVFDGMAIYNALVQHKARVVTHVDGLAASMASIVALAGDSMEMSANSFFMIHQPWSIAWGNASALRKEADLLDKVAGPMVDTYAAKCGATAEQVAAWMDDETWFTAAEAKEAGFADVVVGRQQETDDDAAAALAAFDLSVFAHVPESLAALSGGRDREPTARELEQALRDVGLSQIAAKRMVSAGREDVGQRDAGNATPAQSQRDAGSTANQAHRRAQARREYSLLPG